MCQLKNTLTPPFLAFSHMLAHWNTNREQKPDCRTSGASGGGRELGLGSGVKAQEQDVSQGWGRETE